MVCLPFRAIPKPVIAIAGATLLFGTATPLLKILVDGMAPLVLLALLALGSGVGLLCWRIAGGSRPTNLRPPVSQRERYLLAGTVIVGGFVAPVTQCFALTVTPAATAALLLNFEIVATVMLAFRVFHEPADKMTGFSLLLIFAGSILLAWSGESALGISLGAFGIILSGFFWGIDNNCMAHITAYSPDLIGLYKVIFGGSIAAAFVIVLGEPLPGVNLIALALLTGFFSFGFGLILFIVALRDMGAARAGAIYAAAPFIGCIASLFIFSDTLGSQFWLALPLFTAGALLVIREQWKLGCPSTTNGPTKKDLQKKESL
ncbi:DMT family transporter [Methanoregula sp.]|uniref:DMT family transporter n=1 Tax=Methanoregula sp. TaxID=2052170 RepID=UPI002BC955C8|nr:DMT family transporter [Methanoregula sp.]HVP96231.1 DMT family transporter [Methanoregula sp.]